MKKLIYSLLAVMPLFLFSCGGDEPVNEVSKTVTIEIERSSEQLSHLETNNVITAKANSIEFNKADWSETIQNEGNVLLTKMETNLTGKTTLSFKQKKVAFQLMSAYYLKDDTIDKDDVVFDTKVIIKVNDKIVKTETFKYVNAFPNLIQYAE